MSLTAVSANADVPNPLPSEAAPSNRAPPASASEWWDVALLLRIAHAVARPFVNVDAIIADVTANLANATGVCANRDRCGK